MSDTVYELYNWSYRMNMGCGIDVWGLCGTVFGKPGFEDGSFMWTSCPVEFDEINMIVTTYSGSKYKLMNCVNNINIQKAFILEDIQNVKESQRVRQ